MRRSEENKRKNEKNEKKEGCKAQGEGLPWYEMLDKKLSLQKPKRNILTQKLRPFKEKKNHKNQK